MWAFIRHYHEPLFVWTRNLLLPATSQVASFYVTPLTLCADDRSVKPLVRTWHRHKPAVPGACQNSERPVKSRMPQNNMPSLHRTNQGNSHRLSSELRKLCLDDFPVESDGSGSGRQTSRAHKRAETYEVVFGIAPCLLALTQGRRKARKLFVKEGKASHRASVLEVCKEAHRHGVQIQRVSKKELDKMSSARVHQGVCLEATPLTYLTEVGDPSPKGKDAPLWLVLEGVQDPMNLGAILRSAYFLGVDRVVSGLRHSCPLSPVVSKASSGVMEVIGVYGCENLEDTLRAKVAQGWQAVGTVGAEAEAAHMPVTNCSDFQMSRPTLLLIGGEGTGLSQELRSLCQRLLTIPAGGELIPSIDSLNVSVATGIVLHSLLMSRRRTG